MRETVTGKLGKIEEMFLLCPSGSERLATALDEGGGHKFIVNDHGAYK